MKKMSTQPPLSLRYWNDSILSSVCEPISETMFGNALEELSLQMIETMEHYKGVGLAAPQIGKLLNLFIMKPEKRNPIVVCNPSVSFEGSTVSGTEGCLSLPTVFNSVNRAERVILRYRTPLGVEKEELFSGLDARIIAHEYDHTLGVMFFDRTRVSRQVNKAVEREWEKIKGKYVPYA